MTRVRVLPDRCQGHARCYSIAPEFFDVDDYGNASEGGDGAVPDDLIEKLGSQFRTARSTPWSSSRSRRARWRPRRG